ncbi:uncharacterized protein LOC124898608 [Capsicum annuum]|uniref:uncharacterized protein LOC124898608 n=1 Tax=Capsicum annuum TaxID=4072 RepID=UPI001FB132A8|nr:uncharacterized protein LOC124898608 [Capsicum annuum]
MEQGAFCRFRMVLLIVKMIIRGLSFSRTSELLLESTIISASSTYVYSVYDDGRKYIVCLDRKTCTYGRFQWDEIACEHTIAVLKSKYVVDMKPYCSEFYYPKTLRKTNEESMFPMPGKKDWIVPQEVMDEVVLPPKYKRQPGRPKKSRHKKSSETMTSSSNCCGRCGFPSHNRRTCNFFSKED